MARFMFSLTRMTASQALHPGHALLWKSSGGLESLTELREGSSYHSTWWAGYAASASSVTAQGTLCFFLATQNRLLLTWGCADSMEQLASSCRPVCGSIPRKVNQEQGMFSTSPPTTHYCDVRNATISTPAYLPCWTSQSSWAGQAP